MIFFHLFYLLFYSFFYLKRLSLRGFIVVVLILSFKIFRGFELKNIMKTKKAKNSLFFVADISKSELFIKIFLQLFP